MAKKKVVEGINRRSGHIDYKRILRGKRET